jgi:hypothetical protein
VNLTIFAALFKEILNALKMDLVVMHQNVALIMVVNGVTDNVLIQMPSVAMLL